MNTITRRFTFHAGHRLLNHEGACRHLHGHSYVAKVTVTGPELDSVGRVIDFGVLKSLVGGWIDANWDHAFLVHPDDPLVWLLRHGRWPYVDDQLSAGAILAGSKLYIMPGQSNPTAENIAAVLFGIAQQLLPELQVVRVRIHETENCFADYTEPDEHHVAW